MYPKIENQVKVNKLRTYGNASFPIILDFNFINNKKY